MPADDNEGSLGDRMPVLPDSVASNEHGVFAGEEEIENMFGSFRQPTAK